MLEIGSLVDGKYKILNEIGHGGMSIVYLAMVERANQTWAIKEVRKNGATKDDIVEQGLVAEMNILKRLNHSHLPRIIDIIDYEDSFLIVMDFIEGVDLDKKLKDGPQKWEDVVEWGKQLCDVLAYLHSRTPPIIYRDMKPGNVKLKPDGNVVLFDFGTAREYKSQKAGDDTTCLGTRGYASPEQYGGMGQTDARSDIYCLGATLFHLVTGRIPGGPPDYTIPPIRSICPWLPRSGHAGLCVRGLEKILMKCMQLNPANRYQSCAELMYDLENIDKISDDYVRGLKSKLRTWITVSASSVAVGLLALGMSFGATRTTANRYSDAMAALKNASSEIISESASEYATISTSLQKAIKTDGSSVEAWLYLNRLFASDHIINNNEISVMDRLLDQNSETGRALRKNPAAFAKFAFEWGENLFFFGVKGSAADQDVDAINIGDPEKANPFLNFVVTGDLSDWQEREEELTERLAGKFNRSSSATKEIFKLEDVDYDPADSNSSARREYAFAKILSDLANAWGEIGVKKSSFIQVGGSDSVDFWGTLEKLVDRQITETDIKGVANPTLTTCSIYNICMNLLAGRFEDLKRSNIATPDKIMELAEKIKTKTDTLAGTLTADGREELQKLLNNIYAQYGIVERNYRAAT
ncbi:MAG: serine/threonine protein kinase [Clostridia bacterium]|nr:serine/threonine protein kinase [Clostridia bacterium]